MLYVFLYISELLASKCYHKYQKLIKGVLEDILLSLRQIVVETTSLGAPLCLHYGESKFSLYMQALRLVCEHLLCRHTPFKIKTLVSCIRFLLVSCVVVHLLGLRRGGGR